MRPKLLEFYGVKSYTDKTVINFDRLISGGLFGIFGATGSGKSTILDSIFLALYGRLPKTSDRDDFINVKTGECYVNFTFEIFYEGGRQTFEVRREYKLKGDRKSKPQPKAALYRVDSDGKTPLEENVTRVNARLEEVIGLNIDDFEKCIVLPQGQFSAFVTLTRGDRLKMVSGLFNLDRYGDRLEWRIKNAISDFDNSLSAKKEVLSIYSSATKEALSSMEKDISKTADYLKSEDEKISKIKEEFSIFEKNYDKHKKLQACLSELSSLEKLRPNFDRKRWLLGRYERAAAVKSAFDEKEKSFSKLKENLTATETLTTKIDGLKKDLAAIDGDLKNEVQIRSGIEEKVGLLTLLGSLLEEQSENRKDENKLEKLREDFKSVSKDLEGKTALLKTTRDRLDSVKLDEEFLNLTALIEARIDLLVATAKNSFIREEVDFLSTLKALSGENFKAVNNRISTLTARLVSEDCGAEECVKMLNALYARADAFNKEISDLERSIATLQGEILRLSDSQQALLDRGKQIKARIDRTEEKISSITNGKVLTDYISALKGEKESAESLLNNLYSRRDALSSAFGEGASRLAGLEAEKAFLQKNHEDACAVYDGLIKDFNDLSEVYTVLNEVGDHTVIARQIEDFDNRVITLNGLKKDLAEELDGLQISEEDYQNRRREIAILDKNYKEISIKYNIFLKDYENLSQNFEKRCKIEAEISKLEKSRRTYALLFEGIRGKHLLEYIADEYLSEIAIDGKKILLELTSGRYGLIYRGDFFIEDYGQGGEVRGVATLSGGELFLVSLSLALALSKSIYSRSMRPMEFFFLDEGFGSLDRELIDVVMDCLDKLKNSRFAIGIISHVDGLKERIPVKINVTGAKGEKGSAITVA